MNKILCSDELNSITSSTYRPILPGLTPVICRTIEEIDECMRLRYEEYCLNRGWEAAHEFPDGRERDRYDERAVHILLMDNNRNRPVGTVRIIYRRPGGTENAGLPSFDWSPEFSTHLRVHALTNSIIELSRFTVVRSEIGALTNRSELARGIFPALALVKGMLRATAADNVRTAILTTTPSLQRLLAKAGLRFHDIGVRVEHRGVRIPIYREIPALLAGVYETSPEIWSYVTDNGMTWPLDPSATEMEYRLSA